MAMKSLATALLAAAAMLAVAAPADASRKKLIWGPVEVDGVSQFPIYDDLGAGIYQTVLDWSEVAPTRPRNAANPADPAYRWPREIDFAIQEARRYGMRVALTVMWTPGWANRGRDVEWAPRKPGFYARFVRAASRRYPSVRLWQIWGEPSRIANWRPQKEFETSGPRRYARLLDAAYAALKRQSPRNIVIGGNTFTTGHVTPLAFIKAMRLPGGRRPRMDLYGHNPFSAREPALRKPPLGLGFADFSDLDTLARWIDRYLGRRQGRPIRLYLSEFTIPTDHPNFEFNFYVEREKAAEWLTRALRITRRWRRIYTLGWFSLYDMPPNGPNDTPGDEVNRGLLDWRGQPKPAYEAYKQG
jgi:hypothetical protein